MKRKDSKPIRHIFRASVCLAAVLLLVSCSTPRLVVTQPPPPLQQPGSEIEIADVDLLELTPEMEAFLERYVLPYNDSQTRLYMLTTAVSSAGVLGFQYDAERTQTAAEAFRMRSGNCVGFANMMVAMARRAGLKAYYQEVIRNPEWTSDGEMVMLVKHVNVVVESKQYTYVMDASNLNISPFAQRRLVSDRYAEALYMNNLGVDALLDGDLALAYAYQKKAIEIDPSVTDSWINMSVVLGRNEQIDDAITVLENALHIDSSNYSAMSNLYEIYLERGDLTAAQSLEAKVERYRRNNPYYLLRLSYEALDENNYDQSLELLERAMKKKANDHLLLYALAKTQYLSGEHSAAQASLMRAREVAPKDLLAHYSRPLDVLIAEDKARREALEQLQ